MKTPIVVALITATAGLAGNLVTSFGPAILSWGQKPIFATSEIYRDLLHENPELEKTLSKQLLQSEFYYTYWRTEVTFKEIEDQKLIFNLRNITKIRNPTGDQKDYQHVVSSNNTVFYESVIIKPQNGPAIVYDKNKLTSIATQKSAMNVTYPLPKVPIKGYSSLEVESQFSATKPVTNNEIPIVTNRFINAPVTFVIRNEINNPMFKYSWDSLAFDLDLPSEQDPYSKEINITIPGPIFPGQGISLSWDMKE